jgi:hypothetical protein
MSEYYHLRRMRVLSRDTIAAEVLTRLDDWAPCYVQRRHWMYCDWSFESLRRRVNAGIDEGRILLGSAPLPSAKPIGG